MNQITNKGNGFKVNEFEEERRVYAKCLKREGVTVDGDTASILENQAMFCCKCRSAASPAYAKKFGKIAEHQYFCTNCSEFVGKCFLCGSAFISDKSLKTIPSVYIECTKCTSEK